MCVSNRAPAAQQDRRPSLETIRRCVRWARQLSRSMGSASDRSTAVVSESSSSNESKANSANDGLCGCQLVSGGDPELLRARSQRLLVDSSYRHGKARRQPPTSRDVPTSSSPELRKPLDRIPPRSETREGLYAQSRRAVEDVAFERRRPRSAGDDASTGPEKRDRQALYQRHQSTKLATRIRIDRGEIT